jgi:hypothetical protein
MPQLFLTFLYHKLICDQALESKKDNNVSKPPALVSQVVAIYQESITIDTGRRLSFVHLCQTQDGTVNSVFLLLVF